MQKVARLLQKIAASNGNPAKQDLAMASIYASVLLANDKRQNPRQERRKNPRHS